MARVVPIDDEATIAMLVATKFRNTGHEAHVAADGETGLALVLEQQPYVVLLSARNQLADRQRGTEAGCDDYIVRPFRPANLLERVMSLLAAHQRQGPYQQ